MSMKTYGLEGYGFSLRSIKWKENFLGLDDLRENVETMIAGTCMEVAWGEAIEDCCLIYYCAPWFIHWNSDYATLTTKEKANEYIYNIFKNHINMTKEDFISKLTEIDDYYIG